LLTLEERELLVKTARLIEELIETIEVSNDRESLRLANDQSVHSVVNQTRSWTKMT